MTRYLLSAAALVALAALLGAGLALDPRQVPSPLLGKATPAFALPRLDDPQRVLAHTDLRGEVSLLNVWATWCVSCRQEHAMLLSIARDSAVPIYGLNYKDDRADAQRWLRVLGDPYRATAFDGDGRVAMDLGVYGAPETYVIDAAGQIAYKHIGPVTREAWERTLSPLIERLRGQQTS